MATALGLALLATPSGMVWAACKASDMNGSWEIRFRTPDPQQVGTCNLNVESQEVVSGECYNITTQTSSSFFDGRLNIQGSCNFRAVILLDDGSRNVGIGKLRPKAGRGSGNLKVQTNGKSYPGTFTLYKRLFAQSVR